MSRIENLLNAFINEEDVSQFEPQSRCEEILKSCCTGEMCEIEPQSRIEGLLINLQKKLADENNEWDGTIEVV